MLPPRLAGLVAVAAVVVVTTAATTAGCGGTNDDRPPKWSFISATIIEPSCATVNCHSAITHQGAVDLSSAKVGYQTLVLDSTFYVIPKNPDASTLVRLMNAVGAMRMPPDNPLPQADIELISAWITKGADDN
jgi:hypothetical protein